MLAEIAFGLTHATTWMNVEDIVLSEMSQLKNINIV